mmetsp:Transcript_61640/g.182133  ORF Transcript_61640/g.182133 Transcript_61640/m.182133 type:complete len:88 (-) Transcript_61640:95-358(-)
MGKTDATSDNVTVGYIAPRIFQMDIEDSTRYHSHYETCIRGVFERCRISNQILFGYNTKMADREKTSVPPQSGKTADVRNDNTAGRF